MRLAEFFYHDLGPIRIDGLSRLFGRFFRGVVEGLGWGLGLGLGFALAALIFCQCNGIDTKPALEKAGRWSGSSTPPGDRPKDTNQHSATNGSASIPTGNNFSYFE